MSGFEAIDWKEPTDLSGLDARYVVTDENMHTLAFVLCGEKDRELAYLFAAAPALKEALEDALAFVSFHGPVGCTPDTAKLVEQKIRAALAACEPPKTEPPQRVNTGADGTSHNTCGGES